mmetsp:Transcript_29405/g.61714  ORF Transcript_29405/g.61714 Transcript_29405/m.61714 type:complete len:107 (+) Transcript_29405:667-987(+)
MSVREKTKQKPQSLKRILLMICKTQADPLYKRQGQMKGHIPKNSFEKLTKSLRIDVRVLGVGSGWFLFVMLSNHQLEFITVFQPEYSVSVCRDNFKLLLTFGVFVL